MSVNLKHQQKIQSGIAFIVGNCPFCGVQPKQTGMIKQTDILYRCPQCDFPVETFFILGLLEQFEHQIEQQLPQLEIMLGTKEHMIQ